ncbi:hypothetical protein MPTK1_7g19520 [Marchantia polymorpha subsp. ruderalis]|uniref:Uncharacterized protein n=2 Tax=Marchantia polymorpha TaxID=3197 RepID=A0AAF6C1G8_MARPO|nr:hypothetical protein MARPO_0067s0025 [Marchantia polymorpha]BBN18102.1 hypothetical protein Mp_7g19520 [Marchantia polymorpha subsp. ruderalis]|eukprot:PTQ35931.1 hypothetical protein MARPO_0067s0025 [Marchantia polymorpha]
MHAAGPLCRPLGIYSRIEERFDINYYVTQFRTLRLDCLSTYLKFVRNEVKHPFATYLYPAQYPGYLTG